MIIRGTSCNKRHVYWKVKYINHENQWRKIDRKDNPRIDYFAGKLTQDICQQINSRYQTISLYIYIIPECIEGLSR